MKLFDTHTHYDDERFDGDRDEVLKNLQKKDIGLVVNASSDMESSVKSIEFSRKYDYLYSAVGVHPHDAIKGFDPEKLIEFTKERKVVAIGEIGLDYYYDLSPREVQKKIFIKQLNIAKSLDIPVIIHDRDAHKDSLDIIKDIGDIKGVFHCFSGSVEMAIEIIKLGMYISFAGPITFKNAKKSIEVAKSIPQDRILIETDCPYLSPEPFRGKRNDSGYLKYIAEKIAQILNYTYEEVADITFENGRNFFRI